MNHRPANNHEPRFLSPAYQRGVGLIEVLVAVLVLAIGLVGIALVQTRALTGNNSSMGRSMAVVATYSILDAMRADRANAIAGNYNTTVTADACPATGTLSAAQLLAWCTELGNTLGAVSSTTGTISCNAAGNCLITIQFDDSRLGAGSTASQQVVTRGML